MCKYGHASLPASIVGLKNTALLQLSCFCPEQQQNVIYLPVSERWSSPGQQKVWFDTSLPVTSQYPRRGISFKSNLQDGVLT